MQYHASDPACATSLQRSGDLTKLRLSLTEPHRTSGKGKGKADLILTGLTSYSGCEPIAIGSTTGLLYGGAGRVGIVICDDWGYDALCARRSLRMLGDALACRGYPVLRYDHPGMGGSLPEARALHGLEPHLDALGRACAALRSARGVEKIVLIGLGFGTLLAARAALDASPDLAGLVLLAPVTNGRVYLRELQLRAAMIADVTGIKPQDSAGIVLSVAGFEMAAGLADEVKAWRLSAAQLPERLPTLVLHRPGRAAEQDFGREVAVRNTESLAAEFTGYDRLMTDPTAAETPERDLAAVCDWISSRCPAQPTTSEPASVAPARIIGDGFSETVAILGRDRQMVGTWCAPFGDRTGAAVLFLSAGSTPRAGWAGNVRETARWLARQGIPSLRVDVSDVGDSRAAVNGGDIVHYSPQQTDDVVDALDFLQERGEDAVIAAGTCSGAYLALRGAVVDQRIAGLVIVNLQRFLWDPREDVASALRFDHTDTKDYARKLIDLDKLKKLVSGQVPIFALASFLLSRSFRKFERKAAPHLFGLTPFARIYRQVHAELRTLQDRGTAMELLFSRGDPSIAHMEDILGKDAGLASQVPALQLTFIDNADHNLTPCGAQDIYRRKIAQAATTVFDREEAPTAEA